LKKVLGSWFVVLRKGNLKLGENGTVEKSQKMVKNVPDTLNYPETIACANAIRRMAKSITSGSLPAGR
jgi:hypothetical protein